MKDGWQGRSLVETSFLSPTEAHPVLWADKSNDNNWSCFRDLWHFPNHQLRKILHPWNWNFIYNHGTNGSSIIHPCSITPFKIFKNYILIDLKILGFCIYFFAYLQFQLTHFGPLSPPLSLLKHFCPPPLLLSHWCSIILSLKAYLFLALPLMTHC